MGWHGGCFWFVANYGMLHKFYVNWLVSCHPAAAMMAPQNNYLSQMDNGASVHDL